MTRLVALIKRSRTLAQGLLLAVLPAVLVHALAPSSHALPQCNGTPSVGKFVHPPSVEAGEPVTVVITVAGCSGQVIEPIPFDGVLLIDMSDSMDDSFPYSDPNDKRLDAAISFVNCAAPDTNLAIIAFSTEAALVQPMTSDKDLLELTLNGLRGEADGGTNLYGGMQLAQQHLIASSSGQREQFILLLTDGEDNSGHTDSDIVALANVAQENDVQYFTIALGSEADLGILVAIAMITDGLWRESPSAANLEDVYASICATAGSMASTRNIELHETLASGVGVVAGSVLNDIPLTTSQIVQLESGGGTTGSIGKLGSGEGRLLQFDVAADCLGPDSEEEAVEIQVDHNSSKVTYVFGVDSGEVPVPGKSFQCTRPGDLRIRKEYDFQDSRLYITLESRYLPGVEDNIVRNIEVVERPSMWFQADLSTATPPLTHFFPGSQNDALLWRISELGPKETETLTVDLVPTICSADYDPPIDVNAEKATGGSRGEVSYVRPDGTANRIPIPPATGSLASVEACDGRPDLAIAPAFTIAEYKLPPPLSPTQVLYKHDSPGIWVDSLEGNGFWDRTSENVGDFIRGAELDSSYLAPIDSRINVPGQGDYFFVDSRNKIYINMLNSGNKETEDVLPGVKLRVFNHTTLNWDVIASGEIQVLAAREERLLALELESNQIQSPHIEPYAISAEEALTIVRTLDNGVFNDIGSWAWQNRSEWDALANQPDILPQDLLNALPDECPWYDPSCSTTLRGRFEAFLGGTGRQMAWGKPSVQLRVELARAGKERHIHNNVSTEVIRVGQVN
jgi:hypothetical protein